MSEISEVRVCIVTGYGINADYELETAFHLAGGEVARVHIRDLIENPNSLLKYHILAFPGGFSFGDHLGSGLVFAAMFKRNLREELESFLTEGKLIIGICNGFQVLVKMGVLPNMRGDWKPEVSLIHNEKGVFENSWVRIKAISTCKCIWTKGIDELEMPIRNGEGRFIAESGQTLDNLERKELIALTYSGPNPNGSQNDVAGISDTTGRILGLMPHPEANIFREQHPTWTRRRQNTTVEGAGLGILRNGVSYARERLCQK